MPIAMPSVRVKIDIPWLMPEAIKNCNISRAVPTAIPLASVSAKRYFLPCVKKIPNNMPIGNAASISAPNFPVHSGNDVQLA